MNDIVISARGLGKKYLIGHQVDRNVTLREQIMAGAGAMKRNLTRTLRGEQILAGDEIEEFWALRDVDFDIHRGDVVGVIGRNGAGKSTLLKILSRITEPTTGKVEIRGRVASLLEVGTGFHPELTGRENIFLNGAILGMSQEEIRRKFDEIVDFAEVEKFLDTPVKRYSSGMYVRLAFSVAAHLEPEILIVDEVLAVGDVAFQRKCLDKMGSFAGSGRTVFFVSHNLGAVSRLCTRGILLQSGRVKQEGNQDEIIDAFLETGSALSSAQDQTRNKVELPSGGALRSVEVDILGHEGSSKVETGKDISFEIRIDAQEEIKDGGIEIAISNDRGESIFHTKTRPTWNIPVKIPVGHSTYRCAIENLPLVPGKYLVGIYVTIPMKEYLFNEQNMITMVVKGGDSIKKDKIDFPQSPHLWPTHHWAINTET